MHPLARDLFAALEVCQLFPFADTIVPEERPALERKRYCERIGDCPHTNETASTKTVTDPATN